MEFKTKEEFIEFIEHQTNIELKQIEPFNKTKHILYTTIQRNNQNNLLCFLNKLGIRYEEHLNNKYWIWINSPDKNC